MIKIGFHSYFWQNRHVAREALCRQLPNPHTYSWGELFAVDDSEEPDFYVIFQNDTKETIHIPSDRKIYLQREPEGVQSTEIFSEKNHGNLQLLNESFQFVKWQLDRTYSQIKDHEYPVKTGNLCAVVSHRRELPGQIYRSNFVIDFLQKFPQGLDLYGSLTKTYPVTSRLRNIQSLETAYQKMLKLSRRNLFVEFDKYDTMSKYHYTYVPENSIQRNYFTEKIVDTLLAWSMPIYWGCQNLSDFFPKDAYHEIDITDPNAHEYLYEVSRKPLSKNNIEAIRESRDLILNRYNLWPALETHIKNKVL